MKRLLFLASLLAACLACSCAPTDPDANPAFKAGKRYPAAFAIEGSKNIVISPYRPYNKINVKGMSSGHLVRDPSTAKMNKATGKPDINTAKIFRIP